MDPTMEEEVTNYYRMKARLEEQKRATNGTKKCVNCRKPSMQGTLFTTVYHEETDRSECYRELKASCGFISDPCNLKLSIRLPKTESLSDILEALEKETESIKRKIMNDKNQLLFGYINDDEALKRFNENKEALDTFTLLTQKYLDIYTSIVANPERKERLDEATLRLYDCVQRIKKEMAGESGENNAVHIYRQEAAPLMQTIRDLTYEVNMTLYDHQQAPILHQRAVAQHYLDYTFI
jgi:hypothetical protein